MVQEQGPHSVNIQKVVGTELTIAEEFILASLSDYDQSSLPIHSVLLIRVLRTVRLCLQCAPALTPLSLDDVQRWLEGILNDITSQTIVLAIMEFDLPCHW